jgi:hypothetical protein
MTMSRAVRYLIIRSNNSKKYGESIQVYGGFKNKEKAEKCAELLNAQQNANSAIELQLHLLGYYDDLDIGDDSTKYYVEECDIYDEDEEILDEVEKKYLHGIVAPFRNRVTHIYKVRCGQDSYRICIYYKEKGDSTSLRHFMTLPTFKRSTKMYENMKVSKAYTLEELGL